MKDTFKFVDLIGLISFLTFLIPDNILTPYKKWIIFLGAAILFLIYKILSIMLSNRKNNIENTNKYNTLQSEFKKLEINYDKLNKLHVELGYKFDKRVDSIENLKSSIYTYNHLITVMEYSLSSAMLVSEDNKEFLDSLLRIILSYKQIMESDNKNE